MNAKAQKIIGLMTIVVVLLTASGCSGRGPRLRIGELQTESQAVELGGAQSVRVELEMGAGELDVAGGADGLLEADFTYNVAEFKPEVKYSGGTLSVRQPHIEERASLWDVDDYRYQWDLRLNSDVPIEMAIDLGAGKAALELGRLSLTRLGVKTGAGDVTIDLSSSSSLTRLEVEMGTGQVTVDLTGNWQEDLDVDLTGGVGELIVRLPSSIGVRVDIEAGISGIDTQGLTKDGDHYVNDAYGKSGATLRIDIKAGIGSIKLHVAE